MLPLLLEQLLLRLGVKANGRALLSALSGGLRPLVLGGVLLESAQQAKGRSYERLEMQSLVGLVFDRL